jgi:hypothetical protein
MTAVVDDKPPAPKEPMKTRVTTIAACVLTAMYLVFGAFLFAKFVLGDGPDKNWERALIIFNAVSAIGYAAVGVLLGTTVQQVNVTNAKKEADKAKASEAKVAEQAKVLSNAAEQQLSNASGLKEQLSTMSGAPKLWSGRDPAEEELRQAIRHMNRVLEERAGP